MYQARSPFSQIPPVTKNLIIINGIMLLASFVLQQQGFSLTRILGLYYPGSDFFRSYQIVTHLFMHGGLGHLFFNMFALFMFGRVLEGVWGSKRFLTYYLVTGLGAALLHTLVNHIEIRTIMSSLTPEQIAMVKMEGSAIFLQGKNFTHQGMGSLNMMHNIPTVGASGAVFGVLLGFGMLFPNTQLMLLFPPIPIRAKYFVIGYGVLELILGLSNPGSNIAHFAHLGGMVFGFILIKYWNKNSTNFY